MWKWEEDKDGKMTKVPYHPSGYKAASTRAEDWSTFEACVAALDRFHGIGFVFESGVVGIDLDHCMGKDGVVAPWAREILERFKSYTERSPSGDGLHIIIESDAVFRGRNMKLTEERVEGIECYMNKRFFTVTGQVFEGRSELRDCDVMDWFNETFPKEEEKPVVVVGSNVALPDDETIKRVMFGSKHGHKIRELYEEGKWREQKYESQSQADLALVGNLMFFCANDAGAADRLFRKSDLFREKWDEKRGEKTYGQLTLDKSVQKDVMKWKKKVEYITSVGKDGVERPMLILENICRVIESDEWLSGRFRFNDFSHMVEAGESGVWANLTDNDILEAQRFISTNYASFARVSKEMVVDAIKSAAKLNKVNPPVDYLSGLVWDREPRIDRWLEIVFGTPDDELHRAMGSNWLKGLVKRVLSPGCLFDEVLVLEGAQGWRKSTSLRVLGQPWHTECTLSTEDKDFYMLMARSVIVEFAEGDIIGKTSAQKLKAIITKTEDTFRPPYERGMMTFKRGCVFAMTTNNGNYQKDETGGRRWLPVVLGREANVDWLAANRDQMYAEAVYRVQVLKETTYEYPKEALAAIQEQKMEEDAYDEAVKDWYDGLTEKEKEEGVRIVDIFENVIMLGQQYTKTIDWYMERRLGGIAKRVLRLKSVVVKKEGKSVKRWVR